MKQVAVWVLALVLASTAFASDEEWTGDMLRSAPSGSCTPTSNAGTNFNFTTMDCTQTGQQHFTAEGFVNADAAATFTIHVFWLTPDATASKQVMWQIANAVCLSNLSACTYPTMTPANAKATVALTNLGNSLLMESTFSGSATFWNVSGAANCGSTNCQRKPLLVDIARDNTTLGAANVPATVKVQSVVISSP